jgi:hypothetical protein
MESSVATKDATPATITVALASLEPVPPANVSTGVVSIFSSTTKAAAFLARYGGTESGRLQTTRLGHGVEASNGIGKSPKAK